jgi:hypothetical protein
LARCWPGGGPFGSSPSYVLFRLGQVEDKSHQVVCLIGDPGSGKSVVLQLLLRQLLEDPSSPYVVLSAQLPALERPHVDLVPETLSRFYHFPDARIGELQRQARDGERRIVFIADALDETPQDIQNRNLFQSNRLETWGAKGWPKLIITCRTTHFPQDEECRRGLFTAAGQDPRILEIADFSSRIGDYFAANYFWQVHAIAVGTLGIRHELNPIVAGKMTHAKLSGGAHDAENRNVSVASEGPNASLCSSELVQQSGTCT